MKKIVLLSLIILTAFLAKAQPQKEMAGFNKWTNTLDSNRQLASKAKDYNRCVSLINEWAGRYNQLSPALQKAFPAGKPACIITWPVIMR